MRYFERIYEIYLYTSRIRSYEYKKGLRHIQDFLASFERLELTAQNGLLFPTREAIKPKILLLLKRNQGNYLQNHFLPKNKEETKSLFYRFYHEIISFANVLLNHNLF